MKTFIDELKKYKIKMIGLLFSFLTFLSFLIYFKIIFSYDSYNFMLLLLFLIIFVFYNNYLNKYVKLDKRTKGYSFVFSLIISFILIVGSLVSSHVNEQTGLIFNFHTIIYAIVGIIGFLLFFNVLIGSIINKRPNIIVNKKRKMTSKLFMCIMGVLLLCWLPYFLRYFPAVMTPDSYYVLHYIENVELNDFHVFGHTWFVGLFYIIGKFIFHNANMAVAFYIIIQMLICAFIFTYIIKFLYEKKIKNIYLIICTLFFALSPLFAIYSITLWRDILFSMVFATLFISLYKFVENDYKLSASLVIIYVISILAILFFRNNGIYVFLLFIPFFILLSKKNRLIITFGNLFIVIIYFVIKGPVFDCFGVVKTTSVEAFSMPLQQISRVVVNEGQINNDTYKYLNEVLDIPKIKETYNPTISDFVKRAADNEKISDDKIEFFKTWIKIGFDNPRIYIESYLCSTLGYWYPDVIYWATAGESKSNFNDVNVYSKPLAMSNLDLSVLTSRKIPLSSFLWSIGTMFIILLSSTILMVYNRKTKYLLPYIPLYCLWLSLMIASPVFAELRYIYALFVCIPLLIFLPFIQLKNNEK